VQAQLGSAVTQEQPLPAVVVGSVDLEGAENCSNGCNDVWHNTGKTDIVSLPWNFIQSEGVLDDFL